MGEAVGLKLSDVDMEGRSLHVKRLRRGLSTTHPLRADELLALKAWTTEQQRMKPQGKALFISERRQPLSRKTAWVIIRDYGEAAELTVAVHPPMLRHACGYSSPIKARIRGSSGLSRPPKHSAHGEIYREQSGTV